MDEEVHRRNGLVMVSEETLAIVAGSGTLGARRIHRETLLSERSKPSLSSSP